MALVDSSVEAAAQGLTEQIQPASRFDRGNQQETPGEIPQVYTPPPSQNFLGAPISQMPGYTPPAPLPVTPYAPNESARLFPPEPSSPYYGATPNVYPNAGLGNLGGFANDVYKGIGQGIGALGEAVQPYGAAYGRTVARGGLLGTAARRLGVPNTLATGGLGVLPGTQATHEQIGGAIGGFGASQVPFLALYAAAPEVGIPTAALDVYFGSQAAISGKQTIDAYQNGQIDAKTALLQLAPDIVMAAPAVFHGLKLAPELKAAVEGAPQVQRMGGLAGERGSLEPPQGGQTFGEMLQDTSKTVDEIVKEGRARGFSESEIAQGLRNMQAAVEAKMAPVGPEGPKAELPASAAGANLPVPPEAAPVEQNPLDRAILETTQALKSAEKLRPEQEAMFKQQRAQQLGAAEQAFQTGQGVQAAKSAAGGQFERPTFAPLELTPANEKLIRNEIDTTPKLQTGDRFQANAALDALMRGELPQPKQLEHLNTVMGQDFTAALLDKIPVTLWAGIVDAANLPRTLLASVDLSAPFRQGIVLAPGHPKEFVNSFGAMLEAALSDKNALKYDDMIQSDPLYRTLLQAGLDHVKEYGTASVMKEEGFMSRLAEQLPVLGPLIRGSERAYVTFLNKLRWDVAYTITRGYQRDGIPLTEERLKDLSLFLNNATGRGSLGRAQSFGPALNAFFFSPRLLASRAQLVGDLLRPSQDPFVRKQAMRDLAAFVGTGTAILSLVKLSGMGNVQLDPRSPDFGKVQIGNTRIDFWGGFQPIVRYAAQLAPVQGKLAGTKVITGSHGNVVVPADWGHTFTRFIRSKLAPIPGLGVDIQQGQDILGNPVGKESFIRPDRQNPIIRSLAPLAFQDLADAIKANGFGGVATGAAGALGLGVSTQEKNPKFMAQADKSAVQQKLGDAGWDKVTQMRTTATDHRSQYIDKYGGADTPENKIARDKAAAFYDKSAKVKQYRATVDKAELQFWTQHRDLLKQAYNLKIDTGLTQADLKRLGVLK